VTVKLFEVFLVADDDDIYMPHWFRTQAEALEKADWSLLEGRGGSSQ